MLKNLSPEQISRFREQVEVVDLIGEQRVERIMETVEELDNRSLTHIQGSPMTSRADAEEVSCWHRESVDYHSDPAGFFIIQISRAAGGIVVEHYNSSFELPRVLHGKKALEFIPRFSATGG